MTPPAQASAADSTSPAHEQEALLLLELLRTSRLSLLYAEPGSDKTTLLRSGLMPLLCRRAGDQVVPAVVRTSGVVVPFPDRRSRPSARSSKRRREIVVYCGDWTDTPLAALRESLYGAVATNPVESVEPAARLSQMLEDLSQRFDANFVVLLDRFEDLLQASSHPAAIDQFLNELGEAVNRPQSPANFLIALTEEARPRLAGLRARIPGFDDFSLKLDPPRDRKETVPSVCLREPGAPAAIEPLPDLTATLMLPAGGSARAQPAGLGSVIRAPGKPKVKRLPPPRVQVHVEDVYAMIEAALSRIAMRTAVGPFQYVDGDGSGRITGDPLAADARGRGYAQRKESAPLTEAKEATLADPSLLTSRTPTRGKSLQEAIERMDRRLGARPEGEKH